MVSVLVLVLKALFKPINYPPLHILVSVLGLVLLHIMISVIVLVLPNVSVPVLVLEALFNYSLCTSWSV